MVAFADWETVPFHFIWVSLTLLYGFRVWRTGPTLLTLGTVALSTGLLIWHDYGTGSQPLDELTEVPLMSAMFLAMVWHARRRLAAMREMERVSDANVRLLQGQQRFLQDASHELRTPITVALGHAELIQRAATDPLVHQDAGVVIDELTRLHRLADRMLVLAASESPDFLHTTTVDVEPMVVETLRRWTPTPRRWLLGGVDDVVVRADADRLSLALDAIIENAAKHTSEEDTIELSVRRENGDAVITLTDSGEGIAEADLGRIFDRFARTDAGRGRDQGGMGLGLSIARAIVEAHGGDIRVRSAPGLGSTFEVRLPALMSSLAAMATDA
jgi:signal transduction histidine kinase